MRNAILSIVLFAALANAFTALPALGYSASSGFMIGGYFLFPLANTPGDQFTVDTYYGTAGVIKFQPGLFRRLGNGVLSSTLEYRKVIEKDWYGWGNNTSPDTTATMDFEKRNFLATYTFPLLDNFFLTTGLDIRHSTVFNREESILWNRTPGPVFSSTWTGGLTGTVIYTVPTPLNGDFLVSAGGFFQAGDVSYAGLTGKVRGTVKPWDGGQISLGLRAHRQFGISETPVPYTSGIGQNVNFRGYNDYRFTGPVWTIYQLELKNRIFSLHDFEGNHILTGSVAVFAEAGEAAEEFSKLSMDGVHTDAGCGIRLMLQPNAELRLDAAWGDNGMMIQSGFDQAF